MRFVVKEVKYNAVAVDVTAFGDHAPITVPGAGTVTLILEAPEHTVTNAGADLPQIGEIIEIADQVGAEPPSAASLVYPSSVEWEANGFGASVLQSQTGSAPFASPMHVTVSNDMIYVDGSLTGQITTDMADSYVAKLRRQAELERDLLRERAKQLEATKWVGDAPERCDICGGVAHDWAHIDNMSWQSVPEGGTTLKIGPKERRRIRRREKRAGKVS